MSVVALELLLAVVGSAGAQYAGSGRTADRPFPRIFAQIGQSIAWSTVSGQADIFIVVDTSATMMDRTQGGANRVNATAEAIEFLVCSSRQP